MSIKECGEPICWMIPSTRSSSSRTCLARRRRGMSSSQTGHLRVSARLAGCGASDAGRYIRSRTNVSCTLGRLGGHRHCCLVLRKVTRKRNALKDWQGSCLLNKTISTWSVATISTRTLQKCPRPWGAKYDICDLLPQGIWAERCCSDVFILEYSFLFRRSGPPPPLPAPSPSRKS